MLTQSLITRAVNAVRGQAWSNPLLYALIVGLVAVGLLAWQRSDRLLGLAASFFVAGASLATGALLGFLFGIPRALHQAAPAPAMGAASVPPSAYRPNTNLEDVSDWITKIVIALGLAQLAKLPLISRDVAALAADAFGPPMISPNLAGAIVVYFSILGFLILYLWTRLYLSGEFNRADAAAKQSPAFKEGLSEALLYQPPPNGYEEAIEVAQDYMDQFGDQNWRIWRTLACAYGQQYSNLPLSERASAKGQGIKEKALNAVKQVLSLNPGERSGLRLLWDPALATPQENDLVVFYPDEEFKSVLS